VGDNSDNASSTPTTVRVIYAGGTNNPLANLIDLETGVSAPVTGDVYTIAGNKNSGSSGEGAGLLATNSNVNFDRIEGLGLDGHGNLYIMDYGSHSELAEVNADTGILIYLSADGDASSAGKYTVGDYCSNDSATGPGPNALDEYGDGCPAPRSNSDNAQGNIGVDPHGNLYFADNGDSLIRKLTFNNIFPATTVGSPAATQNLAFLLETGSTGDTVSSVAPVVVSTQGITTGSEFTNAGTGDSCSESTTLKGLTSSSSNTAGTVCIVPVIFKPAKAGARIGAVQVTGTISSVSTLLGTVFLNGIGNGAFLTIDPGASSTLGAVSGPEGVTTDSAGNVYIAYSNGTIYRTPNGGGTPVEVSSGLSTPHQVATDGAGNLYVADSGTNEIVEFPGASTDSAITGTAIVSGLTSPKGVAVDALGNLYIAETGSVLLQSIDNGMQTQLGSGFTTPVALAVDSNDNVYVADTGLNDVEELSIVEGTVTQQTTETLLAGTTPVSVAVDAAGDVYYGDSTKGEAV
jgi:sugar lactone lactonase YvrE